MIIKETVYNGYRNTIEIAISIEGSTVPINHSLISRCQLNLDGLLIDSAIYPEYFDLTKSDRLIIKLGHAGLASKNYNVMLIIFDDTNIDGLVIENNIMFTVI